jgi:hypothetical protein
MKEYVVGLVVATASVFAPIKMVFLVTGILIFADLLLGIIAAKKRGERITSAGLCRTVTKIFVYNSAVALGFLVEKFMLDGFLPVSKIASGLISVVELTSILESLNFINGSPVFAKLIEKLGSVNDKK